MSDDRERITLPSGLMLPPTDADWDAMGQAITGNAGEWAETLQAGMPPTTSGNPNRTNDPWDDSNVGVATITAVDRHGGVVSSVSRDLRTEIDRAYSDALGQALTTKPRAGSGLQSWHDFARPEDAQFFGVDRSLPSFIREYTCAWKPMLRERIRGAWRGMVSGWRDGT